MRDRLGWILAVVALLLVVGGVIGFRLSGDGPQRNELIVLVDGEPGVVWTMQDLMKYRFDWISPKGHLAPAVPASVVVFSPEAGRTPQTIRSVRIPTRGRAFELRGDDVALLDELIFRIDLSRGGTWQLHGRDAASSRRMESATGLERVHKVERIEIVSRNDERP